jgi:hypothetical protein
MEPRLRHLPNWCVSAVPPSRPRPCGMPAQRGDGAKGSTLRLASNLAARAPPMGGPPGPALVCQLHAGVSRVAHAWPQPTVAFDFGLRPRIPPRSAAPSSSMLCANWPSMLRDHSQRRVVRVLFSSTWGHRHVFPMVPLARAFAAAGHNVLWAASADSCERVVAAGLDASLALFVMMDKAMIVIRRCLR